MLGRRNGSSCQRCTHGICFGLPCSCKSYFSVLCKFYFFIFHLANIVSSKEVKTKKGKYKCKWINFKEAACNRRSCQIRLVNYPHLCLKRCTLFQYILGSFFYGYFQTLPMSSISSDRSSDYMIMGYRSRTYSTTLDKKIPVQLKGTNFQPRTGESYLEEILLNRLIQTKPDTARRSVSQALNVQDKGPSIVDRLQLLSIRVSLHWYCSLNLKNACCQQWKFLMRPFCDEIPVSTP